MVRVIGIVSQLHHPSGIYGHGDPLDSDVRARITDIAAAQAASTLSSLLGAVAPVSGGAIVEIIGVLGRALVNSKKIKRVADLPEFDPGMSTLAPSGGILIPSALLALGLRVHADPVLYGLFNSSSQVRRTFFAEGGNVDLLILPHDVAAKHFRHHGGTTGLFSRGLYVPHPKDPQTLVPARTAAQTLRDEMLQDWVRAFEALGAKTIVICDTTVARAEGKLQSTGTASLAAELKAQFGKAVVRESTYDQGTYEPGRALLNKKWLGDFPTIGAIIEGRQNGRQLTYREQVRIDASFGIDTKALRAWGASIKGGYNRSFELAVEFYPRPV